jgi:CheY-like chemotaxis protein
VQRFDVILMDLQMPVMDGLTAMRRIRARERAENRARTPIVAVSANAMTHQVEEALAAGADAHVSKPIDPAALLTAIAELCAGPEEAAEPSAATPIAAPA